MLAHVTKDPTLVEAFEKGHDIHAATASEVMDTPIKDVTSDQRRLAKIVNFGVLYGMSEYGLQQSGLACRGRPVHQAVLRPLRDGQGVPGQPAARGRGGARLRDHAPGAPPLHPRAEQQDLQRPPGRRPPAINHPIQGTASDIVKIAMIGVQQLIEKYPKTLMVLQVHDELLFEIRREDLDGFASDLCPIMQNAMTLEVPLVVDFRAGDKQEELKGYKVGEAVVAGRA